MFGAAEQLRCSTGAQASTSYSTAPAPASYRQPWVGRAPGNAVPRRLISNTSSLRSSSRLRLGAKHGRNLRRGNVLQTQAASTVPMTNVNATTPGRCAFGARYFYAQALCPCLTDAQAVGLYPNAFIGSSGPGKGNRLQHWPCGRTVHVSPAHHVSPSVSVTVVVSATCCA